MCTCFPALHGFPPQSSDITNHTESHKHELYGSLLFACFSALLHFPEASRLAMCFTNYSFCRTSPLEGVANKLVCYLTPSLLPLIPSCTLVGPPSTVMGGLATCHRTSLYQFFVHPVEINWIKNTKQVINLISWYPLCLFLSNFPCP